MNSDEYDYFCNKNISMSEQTKNPNEINIELSEKISEGIYSNLAIISHSHSEFVLDFIRLMPNVPKSFNTPTAQA